MLIDKNCLLVFDLDDTLYKEIDFLISAYKQIAKYLAPNNWQFLLAKMIASYRLGKNVFEILSIEFNVSIGSLLLMYRNYVPDIKLSESTKDFLETIKSKGISCALITDGRSMTQRNKIKALDIENYFCENILISEEFGSTKETGKSFVFLDKKFPNLQKIYIGDNIKKDFKAPNYLGWETICLIDDIRNIHINEYTNCDKIFLPKFFVFDLNEILDSRSF